MSLAILIPAAGQSRRMRGRDKLLEGIDGIPLLARQTQAALNLDLPVMVTLPARSDARLEALAPYRGPQLTLMNIADAERGISASLAMGANWAAASGAHAMMVVLPDLPDLVAQDFRHVQALYETSPNAVIRATDEDGLAGHPTVIPSRFFMDLAQLTGDHGAKDVLENETILPCPLPGKRATTDLDTPEAWDAWHASRGV